MATQKAKQSAPIETAKDVKKTTCNISFKSVKEMQSAAGDLELNEDITFTVTGKITSLRAQSDNNWEDASISLDVSKITGMTSKAQQNQNELDDMNSEKE